MTSRDFCFWLQGVFEVGKVTSLGAEQTELVRRHLALVFKHEIDPSQGTPEHQVDLQAIHDGLKELEKKVDHHAGSPHARPDVLLRC